MYSVAPQVITSTRFSLQVFGWSSKPNVSSPDFNAAVKSGACGVVLWRYVLLASD